MLAQKLAEARRRLNIKIAECAIVRNGGGIFKVPQTPGAHREFATTHERELIAIRDLIDSAETDLVNAGQHIIQSQSEQVRRLDEVIGNLVRRTPPAVALTPDTGKCSDTPSPAATITDDQVQAELDILAGRPCQHVHARHAGCNGKAA